MTRLAILGALPRELSQVVSTLGGTKSQEGWSIPVHTAKTASSEVLIVQTGMGMDRATAALEAVFERFSPGCVVSIGFAGALYAGASSGDLVQGCRFFRYVSGDSSQATEPPHLSADLKPAIPLPGNLAGRPAGLSYLQQGSIITVENPMDKKVLSRQLPAGLQFPVCDMETFALAELSLSRSVPFLAVRSISDTLDEEVPPELIGVIDDMGQPKLGRLFHAVTTNPALVTDVIRLRRNSDVAAQSLARFVEQLLSG